MNREAGEGYKRGLARLEVRLQMAATFKLPPLLLLMHTNRELSLVPSLSSEKGERESGKFRHISCICERVSSEFETTNQIAEKFINLPQTRTREHKI